MGKNLDVILLEDIESLGKAGDIVTVAEGHARNSLFANGQAGLADDKAKRNQEEKVSQAKKKDEKEVGQLKEMAQSLEGTELTLSAQVKDGDEIFGKITAAMIAKELQAQAQLEVKAKDVQLESPITKLGEYDVTVGLGAEVEAKIRVTVTAEAGSEPADKKDE